jgi:hypothetical protein
MEELKEEVDKCSPKEGDLDMESGRNSEAALQRLEKICQVRFKKKNR